MRSSLAIDELSAHRAQSTLPAVWLELAYGRMSADEAAAAMAEVEPPELVERSKALFVPPSAAEEERRLEALLQAHFVAPARSGWSRRVPRWLQSSVVAVAAASLVLVIVDRVRPPEPFDGGYELRMSAGYQQERQEPAATGEVERYREGQRIELTVRPREAETGVGAVAFVVTDGVGTRLKLEPTINAAGVVELVGTPEALGLPRGRCTIVVVIGPLDELPASYRAGDVQDDAEAPYDVVERVVEIVAAPDPAAP